MDKDLTEDKLYQLKEQFNERKINHIDFQYVIFENMHPFYDGNRRTCGILLFTNFSQGLVILTRLVAQ